MRLLNKSEDGPEVVADEVRQGSPDALSVAKHKFIVYSPCPVAALVPL